MLFIPSLIWFIPEVGENEQNGTVTVIDPRNGKFAGVKFFVTAILGNFDYPVGHFLHTVFVGTI